LIKSKSKNHNKIIENTISHIERLKVNFIQEDIRKFFFSTRFLFQTIDRVIIFDTAFNSISDTDTLDLDPRSFSRNIEVVETDILNTDNQEMTSTNNKNQITTNQFLIEKLMEYSNSKELNNSLTFINDNTDQFLLISIKNIFINDKTLGYIAVIENANDIKMAINERKYFILRTAAIIGIVILIFSYVLNRYFLKPIKNLVHYTEIIKDKSKENTNIDVYKNRNDEIGILSSSLDEMTNELQKRINSAENFSRDLVHEIRNPLASLKSASELIFDSENKDQKNKLIKIVSHDVERIERLITDYSQILKDEAAISSEKMIVLDLKNILNSVVDDFNSIYNTKRGISVKLFTNGSDKYKILGIENRIEQIIANLLDNSISFSENNKEIKVNLEIIDGNKIKLNVIDQGKGFKEKDTDKIFKRFYSNRPDKFGEHSGLGLNIVKNLVEYHSGTITAKNNQVKGANVEIIFPLVNS
tara:strand:- start:631 stop:2049 length:1419 start_codon:yes stop_codon:yes gene_type:complete